MGTSLALVACGQKIDASKVPAAVKASFAKEYPGITPKWEKEDGKYEVNFKKDGNIVLSHSNKYYRSNGKILEEYLISNVKFNSSIATDFFVL